MKTQFEELGGTYRQEGDYLLYGAYLIKSLHI